MLERPSVSAGDPDAIVIGAGPNGLTAACVLAKAGLRVLVLEAHPDRYGGAVGSEQATRPGFVHDVGAAFFPFGKSSPAFRELDLVGNGLVWKNAEFESVHPAPDGTYAAISRDLSVSDEHFGSPEDGAAWRRVAQWHQRIEPQLLDAMLRTFPAVGAGLRLLPFDLLRLAWTFLASGRRLSERLFRSEAARRVLPGLALHTDVGPEDTFGSGIGYMLGVTATTGGYSVPQGGAAAIVHTLAKILDAAGGSIRLGTRVERVIVEGGRAVAVALEGGEELRTRAVLANTAAPTLFVNLIEERWIPGRVLRRMRAFPRGWGTFKVDWALSGPVPWTVESARRSAVVHAGDSIDDLSRFTAQVRGGSIPENPYLVIGQQSLCDPTRAPDGQQVLWAYSRVPARPQAGWASQAEPFGDAIDQRIEALAPGFGETILERRVVSPDDLEAMDANLLGGDLGGGSNAWHRQLLFRPIFPYFRYRTPVRGLYLCSSYAHPGAGVHGMCGYNAGRIALRDLS
jgi:phytoene dehydrogenase-like protein